MADKRVPRGGRRLLRRFALVLALALLCVLAASAAAAAASSQVRVARDVREYRVGPPSNNPEGVVYDAGTRAFYGGAENGGTLYKATLGDRTARLYLPPGVDGAGRPDGRTEAVGVNTDAKGRLYVAGGSSGNLYVYDIRTKKLLAKFRTGAGGFVNDVTIAKNGDVYFTDSFRPYIYRATAKQVAAGGGTPESIPLTPEVDYGPGTNNPTKNFNANGIRPTPDGKYILFDDLNDAKLYRLTPPPEGNPGARKIEEVKISGGSSATPTALSLSVKPSTRRTTAASSSTRSSSPATTSRAGS